MTLKLSLIKPNLRILPRKDYYTTVYANMASATAHWRSQLAKLDTCVLLQLESCNKNCKTIGV